MTPEYHESKAIIRACLPHNSQRSAFCQSKSSLGHAEIQENYSVNAVGFTLLESGRLRELSTYPDENGYFATASSVDVGSIGMRGDGER